MARGQNFVNTDDVAICRAMINVSQTEGSAKGTDQTANDYWISIGIKFHEFRPTINIKIVRQWASLTSFVIVPATVPVECRAR